MTLDAAASAIMIALNVDVDVFALARAFGRVGAEVPVAVERVDGVLNLLAQDSLTGFVTQDVGWEEHLDLEDSLGGFGSWK